ncbi:MAG: HAD family hydrolase [Lachnospiraceae bacterium]|nr:HAD family hydrolase [Lachnospiraceae bacterium]
MQINTVIFDLDGTLLDTLEDLHDGVNTVLKRYHYPERTLDEIRTFVGNGIRVLMKKALPPEVDEEEFEEIFASFKEYYTAHCQIKTKAYPQIMELLEKLKDKQIKMAIVSNKNDAAVKNLNEIYFKKYIDTAIGQKEGIRKKPAPDSVFEAIRQLDSSTETTLYVGDSEVDCATAKNAEIPCAIVAWGFRTREELEGENYQFMAQTPFDLLTYIEK